jgi:PKD repeat protein
MVVAIFLIAALLMVSLPAQAQPQAATHGIALEVFELSRPSVPVVGARVTFTDAHTGVASVLFTNTSGGVSFFPSGPAYFKIIINATGFYDSRCYDTARNTDFIRFDDTGNVALGVTYLARPPAPLNQIDIGFSGASPATGVDVRIAYSGVLDQTAYEAVLTANTVIMLPAGNYRLVYGGPGLQPNSFTFSVVAPRALDLTLIEATVFTVNVTQAGVPLAEASAYLVSRQKAELGRMLLEPSAKAGGQFTFNAYPGEFYLVAGSPSGKAKVVNVTLPTASVTVDLASRVRDRTTGSFQISNADWNITTIVTLRQLQGDSSTPMMSLSYLPNFRMQLDMDPTVGGNCNGRVDGIEVYNYTEMLKRMGPDNITTAGLFTVEGRSLISDADQVQYDVRAAGFLDGMPVWSEAEYSTTFTARYAPITGSVPNGQSSYIIVLNPAYNSTYMEWSYKVRLPTNYVLLGASVYRDPVTIRVSDYTTVSIDSPNYRPGDRRPALVSLPVVTAKAPSASVAVVLTSSTYRVDQDTYIVRSGTLMSFTAAGSFDPNGNPLTYIWTFGDGGTLTTTSPLVPHTYWIPNLDIPMSVTVRDVSMNTANASLTLKIDGVNPTAVILANGTVPGPVINVDQLRYLDLSASSSYDLIYNEQTPQGIIKRFDWDFGDGFYANDSVVARHAYQQPGRYNLTVALTDASGRSTIAAYVVQVRDTVGPTVVINITRAVDGAKISGSATIGDLLLFDGSNSTDPSGIVSYSWTFGDGSVASGVKVQHLYARLGTVTGGLTCVDAAGNSGFRAFSLTILPMPGPDLRITEMTFSPSIFMESNGGTVQISLVNVGSATAYNISTSFYLVKAAGDQLLVRMYNVTVNGVVVDHLSIGQAGVVSASISFTSQGSYTILANATADGELNPGDNSRSATVQVQESAWKYAGVYFGVIFLVVVLAVLLYMRRGIGTKNQRGKKGKKK